MKTRKKILAGPVLFAAIVIFFTTACNDSRSKTEEKNAAIKNADSAVVKKRTGKALMKMRLEDNSSTPQTATAKKQADKNGVYSSADVMPSYPGGSEALSNYIRDHIEYPSDAMDNDIEGTVMVEFTVDEKGNVSNVKAINQKIGYGLEDEAVGVVSKTSGWTPARIKNKAVKIKMHIPITYVIS